MADDTEDMVPRLLQAIRDEQTTTSRNLGTLAEGMISLRREVQSNTADIQSLSVSIHGITERHSYACHRDG